ncbi:MAG: tetratricopeptide repeat protein, partial [Terracidiphilus sp.]
MNAGCRVALVLMSAVFVVCGGAALAQQDEGPILRPNKPVAKPAEATVLVICDLACDWKLDGKPRGRIAAGDSAAAPLSLGQHLVAAATEDALDKVETEIEIKTSGQTIVRLALQPVRDARLKAGQQERDKAAQEQAARDEAAHLQEQRNLAAGQSRDGLALYNQKRYDEAKPLFQNACDGGEMAACNNLGLLYEFGLGVTQDFAQARALYRKACDGGQISACTSLGTFFYSGQGVLQDYAQAHALFQRACDAGDTGGCSNLGTLYTNGQGVAQDYAQARILYKKACDGG